MRSSSAHTSAAAKIQRSKEATYHNRSGHHTPDPIEEVVVDEAAQVAQATAAGSTEAVVDEAAAEVDVVEELMETKLKVSELDININCNLKIAKAEENLGQKIDENSTRLTNVEETLANLLKAQQEQNKTNKALIDFLVTNFLGDAKKGESSGERRLPVVPGNEASIGEGQRKTEKRKGR
ncbi:hypothetical protein Dimus_029942 [Dionaea muscipula]